MKITFPLRIVRATTVDKLNAEADQWNAAYVEEARIANNAEKERDELRRLLIETGAELEGAYALRRQACRERDEAREQLGDVSEVVALRGLANDPVNGDAFRVGLDALRKTIAEVDGADGGDNPLLIMLSVLLGVGEGQPRPGYRDTAEAFHCKHDLTDPRTLGDHLGAGRCVACATALPALPDETLIEAYEVARVLGNESGIGQIRDEMTSRKDPSERLINFLQAEGAHQ